MRTRFLDGRDPASRDKVLPHLTVHGGHCLAHSTVQEGMDFFWMEDVGYLSFFVARHWLLARTPRRIVISDPVAAPGDHERLVSAFLAQEKNPIFVQVTRPVGQLLGHLGLQVNQMGVETDLPIPFPLSGNKRGKLRQWRNKALREGVEVFEAPMSGMDLAEVRALSDDWIRRKGGSEIGTLSRPLLFEDEPGVRYFWSRHEGKLAGLAVFDPMYRDGRPFAYYHNMDRLSENAPHGTSPLTVLTALEKFQSEGMEKVALGLSPLADIDDDLNANRFMAAILPLCKRFEHLYPFAGNESHKRKFAGSRSKVYAASPKNNVPTMLAASLAFGLL